MTSTTPQTPWEGAPAGAGSRRWFDWILNNIDPHNCGRLSYLNFLQALVLQVHPGAYVVHHL